MWEEKGSWGSSFGVKQGMAAWEGQEGALRTGPGKAGEEGEAGASLRFFICGWETAPQAVKASASQQPFSCLPAPLTVTQSLPSLRPSCR